MSKGTIDINNKRVLSAFKKVTQSIGKRLSERDACYIKQINRQKVERSNGIKRIVLQYKQKKKGWHIKAKVTIDY